MKDYTLSVCQWLSGRVILRGLGEAQVVQDTAWSLLSSDRLRVHICCHMKDAWSLVDLGCTFPVWLKDAWSSVDFRVTRVHICCLPKGCLEPRVHICYPHEGCKELCRCWVHICYPHDGC